MNKISFEDGTLVTAGYVTIEGQNYEVNEAVYEGNTPLSAFNLNKMQDNIEKDINSTKEHKYTLVLTNAVEAGANITIPCYYVVRSKCNGCVFKWRTPIAKFRRCRNRWTL